jgi:trimeric autotransporter adhesin
MSDYTPGSINTQYVNKFANRSNIEAASFNLTSGQTVVLDLDPYISNKTMQVSTYNGGLTVEISLDGINFFPSIAIAAVGLYSFPLPCRYIQLTASGDCSGIIVGSLSGGATGSGGGGAVTSVNGQIGSVNLSTDDIPEGSFNLYFTDARAESAVVVQTITSGDTTHATSSDALYTALAGKQPTGTYVTAVTGTAPVASSGGTTPAISMSVANSTTNGYLTSTDWNTFNNKQPAGSYVLTTRDINTTSPLAGGGSLASDLTLTINEANSTTSGYLSSTDWNTFNNKQPAGSYITALTGDVVASGPGSASSTIQSNVVSNAKLAQMPTLTIKGNNTGGTANALDLTAAQVNTMLGNISSIGAIDSQTPQANGLDIVGSSLYTQSASTSYPGMVNNTTQSFSGNKTFTGTLSSLSLAISGTAGAGYIKYTDQSATPPTPTGATVVYADSLGRFSQLNSNGFVTTFDSTGITANRVYTVRDVSGKFNMDTRTSYAGFSVSSTPYTILSTDAYSVYFVTTTSAITINLPSTTSVTDRAYIFKDVSGMANTNNISLTPNGTDKIEGINATKLLSSNYGAWTFLSDGAGNWWMV